MGRGKRLSSQYSRTCCKILSLTGRENRVPRPPQGFFTHLFGRKGRWRWRNRIGYSRRRAVSCTNSIYFAKNSGSGRCEGLIAAFVIRQKCCRKMNLFRGFVRPPTTQHMQKFGEEGDHNILRLFSGGLLSALPLNAQRDVR